jgi:hypothetical protein
MDDKRKTLYIETTIPSLATARISGDVITAGRQAITKLFWEQERRKYDLCISPFVIEECRLGDSDAAQRRLAFLEGIRLLAVTAEVVELAAVYQKILQIPDKAKTDCSHLATCVIEEIDYLLSWNCTHLGITSYEKARKYNEKQGLWTPFLVTPDALIEIREE